MKTHVLWLLMAFVTISCNGQNNTPLTAKNKTENKTENKNENDNEIATETTKNNPPLGTWKVDKEFDENGNLIKYDSIYSWSSNQNIAALDPQSRDSLMQQFKAKFFNNYSVFEDQGFEPLFSNDSLFSDRFFNDGFFESPFGEDFMDLDKMRQQMLERQKQFLEKYQSQFIKPETPQEQKPPNTKTSLQQF